MERISLADSAPSNSDSLVSVKEDHRNDTVGPWAARKLEALEKYLNFYTTTLSKKKFRKVYIDAFAGSCVSQIRNREKCDDLNLLLDLQDYEAVDEFILGSPIRALNTTYAFDEYYFFDLDHRRVDALKRLKDFYPAKSINVEVGDANPLIQQLASKLNAPHIKGVAFLDPYGPHLDWATIEALAKTKNFEVIINFPVAMAINRLITKSGEIPDNWRAQLSTCFGTNDWRERVYSVESDLFGELVRRKKENASNRLLDLYMDRLKKIFAYVSTPYLVRNTHNSPLYYLIWAGPHPLGLKGAEYILTQGERVRQNRKRR